MMFNIGMGDSPNLTELKGWRKLHFLPLESTNSFLAIFATSIFILLQKNMKVNHQYFECIFICR
jgi:hypothetical protein